MLHAGTSAANFRQARKFSDVCRSTLEIMQHNTVPCSACLPPAGSPLVSGEHLGAHPAPAPTTPNSIGFGFGNLREADADETLSPIRRIGADEPERVVSACTEIDRWLRDEKKSNIFMSYSLGIETLHS